MTVDTSSLTFVASATQCRQTKSSSPSVDTAVRYVTFDMPMHIKYTHRLASFVYGDNRIYQQKHMRLTLTRREFVPKTVAIANRSRVGCAHNIYSTPKWWAVSWRTDGHNCYIEYGDRPHGI